VSASSWPRSRQAGLLQCERQLPAKPPFNDFNTALRGSAFLQREAKPQVVSEAKDNFRKDDDVHRQPGEVRQIAKKTSPQQGCEGVPKHSTKQKRGLLSLFPGVWLLISLPAFAAEAAPLSFATDIRPILSEKCLSCHGPDVKQRKAELRLDTPEGAYGKTESGAVAIVPGDLKKSAVWARISTTDLDDVMPPPKTNKALTAAQRDLLGRWIAEGARYEQHWAFVPPRKPELPVVSKSDWPRNPVDRFVLARLEKEGLSPSQEAERTTLIRRVALDLTDLPPTVAETDAFLADSAPEAYERVVDRLMATRDYAERRAQDWLDLARYADTRGFADDKPREIWPIRDWVIAAIQRNQPFDQFTIEQLAGDMLPEATTEQRIASAFHRNAPQAKGNTYPVEEYRLKGVVDRVTTTGSSRCSTTSSTPARHSGKADRIWKSNSPTRRRSRCR